MVDAVARGLSSVPLPLRARATTGHARPAFEVRTEYNPERRTAVQIVPALIGVILNMTMVIFTAAAIVRERERGNLELLIATPIRSWELMAGKLMPYVLIGLIQTTLILTVGARIFDVPINGSLLDLYLAAALFIAATLTLGLVISTFARTQFQAFQMSFLTLLPSILLSGFVFPFDGMPPLRAVDRAGAAAHAFRRDDPRHPAARRAARRDAGAGAEAGGVPGHRARDRDAAGSASGSTDLRVASRRHANWSTRPSRRGLSPELGKADTRSGKGPHGSTACARRPVRPEAAPATCGRMGLRTPTIARVTQRLD